MVQNSHSSSPHAHDRWVARILLLSRKPTDLTRTLSHDRVVRLAKPTLTDHVPKPSASPAQAHTPEPSTRSPPRMRSRASRRVWAFASRVPRPRCSVVGGSQCAVWCPWPCLLPSAQGCLCRLPSRLLRRHPRRIPHLHRLLTATKACPLLSPPLRRRRTGATWIREVIALRYVPPGWDAYAALAMRHFHCYS